MKAEAPEPLILTAEAREDLERLREVARSRVSKRAAIILGVSEVGMTHSGVAAALDTIPQEDLRLWTAVIAAHLRKREWVRAQFVATSVLLLTSCASTPTSTPDSHATESSVPAPKPYVIVSNGTPVSREPMGPGLLRTRGPTVFEKGESRDGWVQLFTVDDDSTCLETSELFSGARIELWVSESGLATVLTGPYEARAGRSVITFGAGAVVHRRGDGFVAAFRDSEVAIRPPADRLGTELHTLTAPPPQSASRLVLVDLASHGVEVVLQRRIVRGSIHGDSVHFVEGCALAQLAGELRDLGEATPPGKLKPPHEIVGVGAGTKVRWADGAPAGEVVRPIHFYAIDAVDGAICWTSGAWYEPLGDFNLCVAAESVGPAPPETTVYTMGLLGKEEIRMVIRELVRPPAAKCYEHHRDEHEDVDVRLVVRFVIDVDGSVTSSTIEESSLDAPQLTECVNQALLHAVFPPPTGRGIVIVNYPIKLKAAGPDKDVEPETANQDASHPD